MKIRITTWLASLLVAAFGATSANAVPITLTTPSGGAIVYTLPGITLGSDVTFYYMFESVTYAGGPWPGINASVVNPLLGAFPVGQFNDYHNAPTGWLNGFIDTSSGVGTLHDLAFTANTFGAAGNAVTILIRDIAIDGRVFAAASVPEPGSLVLLVTGLAGVAWLRRRRHTS